ncbi:amidohydrolase family protein [Patescibacteria group bacterium]|nr:amidohydrolase family protein [Patescibacteria group bacterium]
MRSHTTRQRLCAYLCLPFVLVVLADCDRTDHASLKDVTFISGESPTIPPSEYAQSADPERPPIIDAHSHLYGAGIWELVRLVMEAENIATYFNLSGGSPRNGMNNALELAESSDNRVLNFMTVNWRGFGEAAWADVVAFELELAVTEYGYAGLKISKGLGLYVEDIDGSFVAVDDPRLFPLWETAGELGVPVFIHTGDPLAFWDPITPENERYAELVAHPHWSFADPAYPSRETLLQQRNHVLELFPDTTFVCVHFGNNPEDLDYVDNLLSTYPNAYVDLAARIPEIGRHDPQRVRELFIRYSDRILFGTDIGIGLSQDGLSIMLGSTGTIPDTFEGIPEYYRRQDEYLTTDHEDIATPTPIQGDWTIDAINLPEDVLHRIRYQNAYDLVVRPWEERNGQTSEDTSTETVEEPIPEGTE